MFFLILNLTNIHLHANFGENRERISSNNLLKYLALLEIKGLF